MLQRQFLEILLLGMLWGPSFLFTKIALADIEPFTLVALRIGLGSILLFCIVKLKRIAMVYDLKLVLHCLILGFFVNGLPFLCFTFALKDISTSLSALINGTTPILTVILASLLFKDERITWNKTLGISVGLAGFLVLFLPAILGNQKNVNVFAMFLSFVGACSYAVGIVYARKLVQKTKPFVVPILQLFTSLCYLIPIALWFESPLQLKEISIASLASVIGLATLGTTFAYIMYYRIIAKYGATSVSMVTYLLPVFGTLLGVLFLEEPLSVDFCIASALILGGIVVVNNNFKLPKIFKLD